LLPSCGTTGSRALIQNDAGATNPDDLYIDSPREAVLQRSTIYAGLAAGGVPDCVVACPQYGQQA
jgi:hypothetical protein